MTNLETLQPTPVWKWFSSICKIPRPSGKEQQIIAFIESFAQSHHLDYKKDHAGNILITKPAYKGYEHLKTAILQAHLDMVCEKNRTVKHDFEHDPIQPVIDDGWVKAKGTTLGADDGIGIATMLALLESTDIPHGPLECLFTTDEETGLTGARNINPGFFQGNILLNLDSEDEGELFIGCAGGMDTVAYFTPQYEQVPAEYIPFKLSIEGLKGGHSGDDIEKGRANSIKLLIRIIRECVSLCNAKIVSIAGGNLRNAIPREAFAEFTVPVQQAPVLRDTVQSMTALLHNEFSDTEPAMKISLDETDRPDQVFISTFQYRLMDALYACPNGVQSMSRQLKGLVETSTNLASVKEQNGKIVIATSQRSAIDSAKAYIAGQVESIFRLAGARIEHSSGYPGWSPNPNSPIVLLTASIYRKLFQQEPVVRAIHAGLECGLFLEKYPSLDMVSFGPTLKGVHSPDERVDIGTVTKFWDLLLAVLKNIPAA